MDIEDEWEEVNSCDYIEKHSGHGFIFGGFVDMLVEREGRLKFLSPCEDDWRLDCMEGWNLGTNAPGGDGEDGAVLVRSMIVGL